MINNNDKSDHKGRPLVDKELIRSEVIRIRFTPEERLIIKSDCKNHNYTYISTYLHDYYFKTRDSEKVIIKSNVQDDLDNLEAVIAAHSKVNAAMSLLKKYANSSRFLTLAQNKELNQLLKQVATDLHIIKARLAG